jgi:hypothetical protein
VEAWKNILFEHEHFFSRARQEGGGAAAAGSAADYQRVINFLIHCDNLEYATDVGKPGNLRRRKPLVEKLERFVKFKPQTPLREIIRLTAK